MGGESAPEREHPGWFVACANLVQRLQGIQGDQGIAVGEAFGTVGFQQCRRLRQAQEALLGCSAKNGRFGEGSLL